jgi:hypothetical protein
MQQMQHRFRQLGFISTHSSAHDDDGGHRNDGSSPYHMLYDKHRIEPYFDSSALSTNVTIAEGSAATYLPCRVHQLGDRTVCQYSYLLCTTYPLNLSLYSFIRKFFSCLHQPNITHKLQICGNLQMNIFKKNLQIAKL